MHIDRYERTWLVLSILFLLALVGVISFTTFGLGMHLQGTTQEAFAASNLSAGDLPAVSQPDSGSRRHVRADQPPFDQPGVRKQADGSYRVVMVAKIWSFTPKTVEVPAGVPVEFLVTSADVIHGFRVEGTTLNSMIVPGELTHLTYTFDKPGEYTLFCHEYCGVGHQAMSARIVVH